jgi:hypothetical protein
MITPNKAGATKARPAPASTAPDVRTAPSIASSADSPSASTWLTERGKPADRPRFRGSSINCGTSPIIPRRQPRADPSRRSAILCRRGPGRAPPGVAAAPPPFRKIRPAAQHSRPDRRRRPGPTQNATIPPRTQCGKGLPNYRRDAPRCDADGGVAGPTSGADPYRSRHPHADPGARGAPGVEVSGNSWRRETPERWWRQRVAALRACRAEARTYQMFRVFLNRDSLDRIRADRSMETR